MPRQTASQTPPLYELYGEQSRDDTLDGLHCESIADRSRLHNWEIQPHRHAALLQLLLIERGSAQVRLDADELTLRSPALVLVPPLVIHGFRFAPDTAGLVLTLEQQRLHSLLQGTPDLLPRLAAPRATALPRRAPQTYALLAAAKALAQEYVQAAPWRRLALDSAVISLALALARLQPPAEAGAAAPSASSHESRRSLQHLARYREQIEQHYRSQPSVARLAQPLGITTTQLNRLCQRELGCTALSLLHQRLLLEAKRELGYTTLPIRQIADGLGFADPAYFTRFFQRLTGLSPSRWREGRDNRP